VWSLTNVRVQASGAARQPGFALDFRTRLGVPKSVMRKTPLGSCAVLLCAFLVSACPVSSDICPAVEMIADPSVIPQGEMTTRIVVDAWDPEETNSFPIVTTLISEDGTFEDKNALETNFVCDPFAQGPVEVCVEARFVSAEDRGTGEAGGDAGVAAVSGYLGAPHVRLQDPLSCVKRECIKVECPPNLCPIIEEFHFVDNDQRPETNIFVTATDPDGRPLELVTTLYAESGSFEDIHAWETLYSCSEFGVEAIELCVTASDGDEGCDQEKCGMLNCNACPFLYSFSLIPLTVPPGGDWEIQVRAEDKDNYPGPFVSTLTASSGSIDDLHAFDTFFKCDRSGIVDVCVEVDDQLCVKSVCDRIRCP